MRPPWEGSALPSWPSPATPRPPTQAADPWEAAFQAHYVGLCEYVLRLVGSAEAAQDIVHDLFLHLWDTRGPRDSLRLNGPYLYVAARNGALKYLRHGRVVQAWIDRASQEPVTGADTPEDLCLRHELDGAVQRAIAELPGRCRAIFVLRRRDQLSYQEIAVRLGVSLGTVKSQMWRATVRLKASLAPYLAGEPVHTLEPFAGSRSRAGCHDRRIGPATIDRG